MSAQIEAFFVWILLVCVVWHRKNAALKSVLFCTITWKGFRIKQLHYLNTILCFIVFSAQDRLTNTQKTVLDQSDKTCQTSHTKHARLVTQNMLDQTQNMLDQSQKHIRIVTKTLQTCYKKIRLVTNTYICLDKSDKHTRLAAKTHQNR